MTTQAFLLRMLSKHLTCYSKIAKVFRKMKGFVSNACLVMWQNVNLPITQTSQLDYKKSMMESSAHRSGRIVVRILKDSYYYYHHFRNRKCRASNLIVGKLEQNYLSYLLNCLDLEKCWLWLNN